MVAQRLQEWSPDDHGTINMKNQRKNLRPLALTTLVVLFTGAALVAQANPVVEATQVASGQSATILPLLMAIGFGLTKKRDRLA